MNIDVYTEPINRRDTVITGPNDLLELAAADIRRQMRPDQGMEADGLCQAMYTDHPSGVWGMGEYLGGWNITLGAVEGRPARPAQEA